jgi:hypothetical protein
MAAHEIRFDNLLGGGVSAVVGKGAVLKAGNGVLLRGAVLGQVGTSADGTPILSSLDSSKNDGSQNPYGVLADVSADATEADVRISVYETGEFNRAALTFGGTDTIDDHEQALRNIGIFTKKTY